MYLTKIRLINFKNYKDISVDFSDKFNCIVGKNGSGKTNLLEAIHFLSLTKGVTNPIDNQNIRHGENFFSIRGNLNLENEKNEIFLSFESGKKKTLKVNNNEYDKLSDHIGRFPLVIITPYDTDIIREYAEERRKFFDSMICQVNRDYLEDLIKYNHFLKQRNSLLKNFSENEYFDKDLISSFDKPIIEIGGRIFKERSKFVENFKPLFNHYYQKLSSSAETVSITYHSDLKKDGFTDIFVGNYDKDLLLGRTDLGIHKDDFKLIIDKYPVKKFGSQGQQKSFLISLKLAQYDIIYENKGFKPILLMDDIFDKLDDSRIHQLIKLVNSSHFGQLFITDAREERTKKFLSSESIHGNLYRIGSGSDLEHEIL